MANPAESVASPFGWHDTDAVPGPEFTFTQGNNVRATEDRDDNGGLGYVPEGGDNLVFDFPLDFSLSPIQNQDASITNLFYWNNIIHDIWYQYGFDEVSGNFQDNNYERGGIGGDFVIAEVQDGSGTNNANFSSPEDGSNGRMQMYLWSPSAGGVLTVNTPMSIAGSYSAAGANFGPSSYNVTGTVVEALDASDNPSWVCQDVVNVEEVTGNIAMIERQSCNFTEKVRNAQDAGAIAVIMCNHEPVGVTTMGGTNPFINIPSVMLNNENCAAIRAVLSEGVEVTMVREGTADLDSGFDNGIIVHEYGHGVSIRLTGGPGNSGCLGNDRQMGEGWSDWLTLVMTPVSDSDGTISRGIGNYADGGSADDVGIRTYPYTTDMSVNPHTYSDISSSAIPHGVGSIWCAMIWDLYWAMVDVYGFDEDIYKGTGGNNMAMQLVIDGMKMQTCNPDFIDGRDAILKADTALYDGANGCLIWETFARRGLGFSATYATVNAFDVHPNCLEPLSPIADFEVNSQETCTGTVCFTDLSGNFPDSWSWDFGDGNTSTQRDPTHQYAEQGTYAVTLEVTNELGTSTETKMSYITLSHPEKPIIESTICQEGVATLTASTTNGNIEWLDENDNIAHEGEMFNVPPILEPTTYIVQSVVEEIGKVGPEDNTYGGGGYHDTGYRGKVFFEVYQPFELLSLWIDAGTSGNRQFDLENANGQVINSITVSVPQSGPQRVDIGWEILPGNYAIAAESVNLFRNNSGTSYPYEHCSGALSITGSPADAGPSYYYYFYDFEVETKCISESVLVNVDCIFVGIDDNPAVEVFNIFPNPNEGTFGINLMGEPEKNLQLTVFDVLGQAIYEDNYNFLSGELNTQIDLPNMAPGTYIIKLAVRDRANYQKIVVY